MYDEEVVPVAVLLAPPIVVATGPATVDEGSVYSLALSVSSPVAGWTIDWGDGTVDTLPGMAAYATHVFADGPTDHTIQAAASNAQGTWSAEPVSVHVHNAAPPVSITAPASGALSPVNVSRSLQGGFTDPGSLDTHTALWSFTSADLSLSQPGTVNQSVRTVSDAITFATPGVYSLTLSVTDKDGATGTTNTVGDLPAYVVIYDPDGGFVTGGGWILSPAGADRRPGHEGLSGKASFGFVAKYQKGANVPTGNTEFQFKAGDLNFSSTSYDWLVVAVARAQYKGVGTINGAGDYGFMLTAIDGQGNGGGGSDRFRIKLWVRATGEMVYDNQYGAGDSDALKDTTILGGGSIVIHTDG